jgi:dipeptidyl aminopeptidase/acylaminoacyl peptidase
MPKNLIFTLIFLLMPFSGAAAFDIFYPIINSASEESLSVSINTITKRLTYDCLVAPYSCTLTKEVVNPRIAVPLEERRAEDIVPPPRATTTATTTSSSSVPAPTKLYPNFNYPNNAHFLTLSPDKKKLVYFLNDKAAIKTYHRYLLTFEDGRTLEKFGLTPSWELVTDNGKIFDFTTDSSKLIYLDDSRGFPQLTLVDLAKNPINLVGERLITKPYTVLDFLVHDNIVYYIANRASGFSWDLYALNLESRTLSLIHKGVLYTNHLALVGDNVIFTATKDGAGEMLAFNTKARAVSRFSGLATTAIPVHSSEVIATQTFKGSYLPASTTKAVIWLHGGPYRQAAAHRHSYGSYATYDWMLDELVSAGVNVLKLEYPGSMGMGSDYARSLIGQVGLVDVLAVERAIDFLKSRGKSEIYLFGNSYGGYLALKAQVELPVKIKGAIAVAPVTDWRRLLSNTNYPYFSVHFGGFPNSLNDPLYKQADIVGKIGGVTNPVLIFHSEWDTQVPFDQSDYLIQSAKSNVRYLRVKEQGHIITGVSQNEAICKEVASFVGAASTSAAFCQLD